MADPNKISWTILVPRSLKNDLSKICIDEGTSIGNFCKEELDTFISALVTKRDNILKIRKRQIEEAKIVSENPLLVTGLPATEKITDINNISNDQQG